MTLPSGPAAETFSVDAFLGGKVTLVQPAKGHRAGLDAALLQALVPAGARGRAADLGAGVGSVAFAVAARSTGVSVVGIERDPLLVACGADALRRAENAVFAARAELIAGDVLDRALLPGQTFDLVLMNPPFNSEVAGTTSPDQRKRAAHAASGDLLPAWVARAGELLRPRGTLALILRSEQLPDLLGALVGRFGDCHVRPVHPAAGRPATRILATARLGVRTPLAILPALILHQPDGNWTEAADAVLRGRAELAG